MKTKLLTLSLLFVLFNGAARADLNDYNQNYNQHSAYQNDRIGSSYNNVDMTPTYREPEPMPHPQEQWQTPAETLQDCAATASCGGAFEERE